MKSKVTEDRREERERRRSCFPVCVGAWFVWLVLTMNNNGESRRPNKEEEESSKKG